jgi:oxidase EvaA
MYNLNQNRIEQMFLKSAFTEINPFISTEEVLKWLKIRNREVSVKIEKVNFS